MGKVAFKVDWQKIIDEGINLGVQIAPSPTDWIFGSTSKIAGITENNPTGDWRTFLPTKEWQIGVYFDTQACVSFSAINVIETILNYKKAMGMLPAEMIEEFKAAGYFDENGNFNFSDRALAKLSGTTRSGNSGNKVADTIKNFGLIPEKLWPYPREQRTPVFDWDNFYCDIPQEIIDVGKKVFLKWVKVNWEWVIQGQSDPATIAKLVEMHIVESPIQIFTAVCSGWNEGDATPVPKCGAPLAHATMISNRNDQSGIYNDFDTYNPFEKQLAADYAIPWGLKYVLTILNPNSVKPIPYLPYFEKREGEAAIYCYDKQTDKMVPFKSGRVFKMLNGEYKQVKIVTVKKINGVRQPLIRPEATEAIDVVPL